MSITSELGMKTKGTTGGYVRTVVVIILVAIAGVVIVFLFLSRGYKTPTPNKQAANLSGYCVGQTFATGSSGHCVNDIQTLVNYMEHSKLTECPFVGGATLTVGGSYDDTTTAQVKSVQQWAHCYAKQEGFTSNLPQTGVVGKATWGELCTYGYTNPLRNGASGSASSIAAGKDAGCTQLQS